MVGKSEGRQLRGDRRNGSIIYFLLFKSPLRGLTGSHGLLLLDGCLSQSVIISPYWSRIAWDVSGVTSITHGTREGPPTAKSFQTSTSEFQGHGEPSLPHPPRTKALCQSFCRRNCLKCTQSARHEMQSERKGQQTSGYIFKRGGGLYKQLHLLKLLPYQEAWSQELTSACIGNSFRLQAQKGNFPSKASWLFSGGLFFLLKLFEAAKQGSVLLEKQKAFRHLSVEKWRHPKEGLGETRSKTRVAGHLCQKSLLLCQMLTEN